MKDEANRNVYVGHRYVPKIFGEWDPKKSYEGLSIVTHEGDSFTSKKRVPVGVEILNEEYWTVTGNYNAQIEEYRKDVRAMEGYIDDEIKDMNVTVDTKIDELNDDVNTKVSNLSNDVDTRLNTLNEEVDTKLSTLNNDVKKNSEDIDDLKNKSEIVVSSEEPDTANIWFEVL